jgi:hypothetical protein
MPQRIRVLSVAAALLGVAASGAGWTGAVSADQATLPGEAGPGPYVQGCVDCHAADGAENIGALLSALKHVNVDDDIETVPDDCAACHSEDEGYIPLGELAHLVHFESPAQNDFIQVYGGDCLHCHALDTETGVMSVKSGPKNW